MEKSRISRRSFLRNLSLTAVGFFLAGKVTRALGAKNEEAGKKKAAKGAALPPGQNEVPATDPTAQALGYVSDHTKADTAKFPQLKLPGGGKQSCKNCSFYSEVNAGWGKCQVLSSGLVAANGWCASWAKK